MRLRDGLLWILVLALVLRVGVALSWAAPLEADAADYQRLANGIREGRGYLDGLGRPTSWRPPLYPAFLAVVQGTIGGEPAVRLVQAGLSTLTVGLVYLAGLWTAGRVVGSLAALFTAVELAQIFSVSHHLSETLFTTLLMASVVVLLRARGGGLGPAIGAGVLLGLGTLARGALVLFPFAVVSMWLVANRSSSPSGRFRWPLGRLAVLLMAYAMTLAPWALRNARVHDAFVPVATQGGATLYGGNHPLDGWKFGMLPSDQVTRAAAELSEVEASSYLVDATVRSLAGRPAELPRLAALKIAFFWIPLDWEILPWEGALNPTYLFILLWAAVLPFVARGRGSIGQEDVPGPQGRTVRTAIVESWPIWLPVLYFQLIALVFYGSPRFRGPVDPLLAIGAASALVVTSRRFGRHTAVAAATATALTVVALAVAADPLKQGLRSILGLG